MAIQVPIPEWLHGPRTDPASAYLQAYHIGSQLAMEQSRLQQAQINSDRDAQLQQQALQAQMQRAEQEIANRHAYQQASLGIRQQEVDNAVQRTKSVADRAAAKFASQQRFAEGLRSGKYKNVEEALFDNPDLMTPGTTDQLLRGKSKDLHFGAGGEVLREEPDGTIKVVRPKEQRQPTFSVPIDPNNPFGPKLSGPLSDPEIARRYLEAQAAATNTPPAQPGILSRLFGGGKTTVSPSQSAPAVPVATPAAPAPSPPETQFPEGTILKHKDGSRWKVQGGKIVPLAESTPEPTGEPTELASADEEEVPSDSEEETA